MTISILFIILLWYCKDAGIIPEAFTITGTVLGCIAAAWSVLKTCSLGDRDD